MNGDWIKLHRKLLESAVFSDEWLLKLWIWCLLRAGYKQRQAGTTVIQAGSFATGRFAAADELGVSPSKWYRGINQLSALGMINVSTSRDRTVVSICNWTTYQSDSDVHEQQVNSERTASEQQVNSKTGQSQMTFTQQVISENGIIVNSARAASEQQVNSARALLEESKEVHTRKRAVFVKPTLDEVVAYCRERRNNVDPVAWMAYYESNGWRVGKTGMKNWRAAVITWEKNGYGSGNGKTQKDLLTPTGQAMPPSMADLRKAYEVRDDDATR